MRKRPRSICGLVLNFGYVESSRVAPLILLHRGPSFRTLRAALADAAAYFWEDYTKRWSNTPTIPAFEKYLYDMTEFVASAGLGQESFDSEHRNEERWWPWESLRDLLPLMDRFVEVRECAEEALIWQLDEKELDENLRAELAMFKSTRITPDWKAMKRVCD